MIINFQQKFPPISLFPPIYFSQDYLSDKTNFSPNFHAFFVEFLIRFPCSLFCMASVKNSDGAPKWESKLWIVPYLMLQKIPT